MSGVARNNRGFASMVGILIALVVAALIMYKVSKIYFMPSANVRPEDKKALAGEGVNTERPVKSIDIAQQKAAEANKRIKEQENQLNNIE